MNCKRKVTICGVPHEMSIVDGCVLFSNKSGFWGVSGRFIWEFRGLLWYLVSSEQTFGKVAGCHLARMHELLEEHIGGDHEQFELRFKEEAVA